MRFEIQLHGLRDDCSRYGGRRGRYQISKRRYEPNGEDRERMKCCQKPVTWAAAQTQGCCSFLVAEGKPASEKGDRRVKLTLFRASASHSWPGKIKATLTGASIIIFSLRRANFVSSTPRHGNIRRGQHISRPSPPSASAAIPPFTGLADSRLRLRLRPRLPRPPRPTPAARTANPGSAFPLQSTRIGRRIAARVRLSRNHGSQKEGTAEDVPRGLSV